MPPKEGGFALKVCGRFTMAASRTALLAAFMILDDAATVRPGYNVAPTQPIPGLVEDVVHRPQWRILRWGLIPSWAKDPFARPPLINARCETVEQKAAFRGAFRHHRCLIPGDGFYEWQTFGKIKQPYYFRVNGREVFAFAGLWETWLGADGSEIDSCCLLTTVPNSLVRLVHDRMPIILDPADYRLWLGDGELGAKEKERLFQPFSAESMTMIKVDRRVGNPSFDSLECISEIGV